jgi:hypothetical protein
VRGDDSGAICEEPIALRLGDHSQVRGILLESALEHGLWTSHENAGCLDIPCDLVHGSASGSDTEDNLQLCSGAHVW